MTTRINAVGYCRMSTDRQDKSIPEQRAEIEKHADRNGFRIVEWYEDHGISGDKTEKREAFKRMIADAGRGGFEAILVWDQDRFGRFDSMEAGHWIHPLRAAGVRLVTVTEGPIDLEDFGGRIIYSVKQEGKHQFLIDISRNTARGQIKMAEAGHRNSRPPYAYDRMLVDERGEHQQRVRAGEQVAKPRGWHSILVPGNAERVAALKWMFNEYASRTISLRELARELNARHVPSPTGVKWSGDMVRALLVNPIYLGDSIWGRRSTGRYHRVAAGEIKRVRGKSSRVEKNPEANWITRENAHEALIDRQTFAAVQRKMVENRKLTAPKTGETYVLSGLCRCGHCGRTMYGWTKARRHGRKNYQYRVYLCGSYIRRGGEGGCGHHQVHEHALVRLIVRKLKELFRLNEPRAALEERLRSRGKRTSGDGERAGVLRAKIGRLDAEIDKAADRLLRAPADLMDVLAPKLAAMKRERDQLAADLAKAPKHQPAADDGDQTAREALALLDVLEAELTSEAHRQRLRDTLRNMVQSVELSFERHGRLNRCTGGVVNLIPNSVSLRLSEHLSTC